MNQNCQMCIRDSSDTCVTEAEVVGEVSAESDIMLKATVKNNGTVDTDEVVQVYINCLLYTS